MSLFTLSSALLAARPTAAQRGDEDITLAVSKDHSVTTLTKREFHKIVSGQMTKWSDGAPVTLVLSPKGSLEMQWLSQKLLGVPEEIFRRFILEKIFRGAMKPPADMPDAGTASQYIARTPGAIGPIPRDLLSPDLVPIQIVDAP